MQTPLWQTLASTALCVQGIWRGQSSRSLLARQAKGQRPALQALLFDALRHLGQAQALCALLAGRKAQQGGPEHALLCTALALMCVQPPPYAPHTLVHQAVEAARHGAPRKGGGAAGFVNACLRRFLRERAALMRALDTQPAARWNHPAWWVEAVRADHPQHWQAILEASNRRAPMTLRVNLARMGRDECLGRLAAAGLAAGPVGLAGLQLHEPCPVQALPGFDQGLLSVQDAAAQRAAPLLLDALPPPAGRPLRVLDACAAPGGKSAHLLECAAQRGWPLELTALEVDAARAALVAQTLERLERSGPWGDGHSVRVLVGDAGAMPRHWQPLDAAQRWVPQEDGAMFDAILLDAPCTASGISRRQPDVRWLRRPGDVAQLARQQARLLDALWPLLAAGGSLLYCTCSVFAAEGKQQAAAFARRHQAQALPAPGHLLPGVGEDAGDGFFYALWRKPGH